MKIILAVLALVCVGLGLRLWQVERRLRGPAGQRSAARLDAIVPEVSIENRPLEEALDVLARGVGASLQVDWMDLEPLTGVGPKAPVSLRLRNVSLDTALGLVFEQHRIGSSVRWEVRDGVIRIGTVASLAAHPPTYLATYDVEGIIARAVAAYGNWSHRPLIAPSGGLFGSPAPAALSPLSVLEASRIENQAMALQHLISECVNPESWPSNGGSTGRMHYFGGRLLVWQTAAGHARVAELLERLGGAAPLPEAPAPRVNPMSLDAAGAPAMQRRIRLPAIEREPLERVFARLSQASGMAILPRWYELMEGVVNKETPVTLPAFEGTVFEALCRLATALRSMPDAGPLEFGFELRDGFVVFSTANKLTKGETRMFDVRDLLWMEIEERRRQPAPDRGKGLFRDGTDMDKAINSLLGLVYTAPEGARGVASVFGGRLVVQGLPDDLNRIESTLARVRAARTFGPPATAPAPQPEEQP